MNYNVIEIEKEKKKAETEEKKIFFVFFIVCKTDREYRCFGQRKKKIEFFEGKKREKEKKTKGKEEIGCMKREKRKMKFLFIFW